MQEGLDKMKINFWMVMFYQRYGQRLQSPNFLAETTMIIELHVFCNSWPNSSSSIEIASPRA